MCDLLSEEELKALSDHLAAEPDAGDVMPGTGGAPACWWMFNS